MSRDGWIYQGRQQHEWFGHGTKPRDGSGVAASLDERIRTLGLSVTGALRPDERRHPAATFGPAALEQLTAVMRALVSSLGEPLEEAADRLLGMDAASPAARALRRAAELVVGASTPAEMRDATQTLADGIRAVGFYRWQSQLDGIAKHIERIATADDPQGTKSIDHIVRELGVSKGQRRILHDEITGQGLSPRAIRDIARQIMLENPKK